MSALDHDADYLRDALEKSMNQTRQALEHCRELVEQRDAALAVAEAERSRHAVLREVADNVSKFLLCSAETLDRTMGNALGMAVERVTQGSPS